MSEDRSAPAVSVVIPTRNRPDELARCLEALAAQRPVEGGFEVVVVDDGSEVDLAPLLDGFVERLEIRSIRERGNGPATARNRGADAARGDLLAFTDDDCLPEPGWLRALAAALRESPEALVGGRVVNALPGNPYASASQLVHDLVYAHYNRDPGDSRMFASNNMAAGRRAFDDAGGFDENFGRPASEDRELCDRWRHRGGRLVYAADAVVRHAHDMGLRGYVRQHFNYGVGASHYHAVRSERGSGRMADDVRFHLDRANWGRGLAALRRHAAPLRMATLLVVWQLANAAGFFADRLGLVAFHPGRGG